jgi:glycosyltransferase involved in cell wall biosynthesis
MVHTVPGDRDRNVIIARSRGDDDVLVAELARGLRLLGKMASNTASPLGVKLRDVENLHSSPSDTGKLARITPAGASVALAGIPPFAALEKRYGRPLKVAILSDFIRIPYANGAAFQTRFLYQELRRCGHQVTLIGPHDPDAKPEEIPEGTIALPSLPLKTYPGVNIPMPLAKWVFDPSRWDFDVCFAQTTSLLLEFGVWMRKMKGIPLLCVNTTHLVAAYDVLLPEKLSKIEAVHTGLEITLKRPFEKLFAGIYNESDGLVVLSEGLKDYWRERGVTVPVHVIPRAVQPQIFDKPLGADPYTHLGDKMSGPRLLCAGRHTREKAQDRVIKIFAEQILPAVPDATLTVLGDGPDKEFYERIAAECGVSDRVFFPGEVPFTSMPDLYAYADVFVHASLSETYGNVMGEALWCGTPTVAFADGMGVSSQITDGVNGILLSPGARTSDEESFIQADVAFGRKVIELLGDPTLRSRLGQAASKRSRERCSPRAIEQKIADAFVHAQEHAAACGLRPAVTRPKAMQWYTTFQHFRPWATFMSGVYLFGHLRPAKAKSENAPVHPQIGS